MQDKQNGHVVATMFRYGWVINDLLDQDTHEQIRKKLSRRDYLKIKEIAEKLLQVRFITDTSNGLLRVVSTVGIDYYKKDHQRSLF